MSIQNPRELTPEGFEQFVRALLDQEGVSLEDYHSSHLETIETHDGSYVFDVTARFAALGADFLVVVECKRWAAPIEREHVQALEQKRQSAHAQKAMLFSTSRFRRGAVGFAMAHGIALVQVRDGSAAYVTKGGGAPQPPAPWMPPYLGWLICSGNTGTSESLLGSFDSRFGHHPSNGFLLGFLRREPTERRD